MVNSVNVRDQIKVKSSLTPQEWIKNSGVILDVLSKDSKVEGIAANKDGKTINLYTTESNGCLGLSKSTKEFISSSPFEIKCQYTSGFSNSKFNNSQTLNKQLSGNSNGKNFLGGAPLGIASTPTGTNLLGRYVVDGWCSMGFSGYDSKGDHKIISAGHCVGDNNTYYMQGMYPSDQTAVEVNSGRCDALDSCGDYGDDINVSNIGQSEAYWYGANGQSTDGYTSGSQNNGCVILSGNSPMMCPQSIDKLYTDISAWSVNSANTSDWKTFPRVTKWFDNGGTSVASDDLVDDSLEISDVKDIDTNKNVSRSGRSSGFWSGPVMDSGGVWKILSETNTYRWVYGYSACVLSGAGDSGGSFVQENSDGTYSAVGTLTAGGSSSNCDGISTDSSLSIFPNLKTELSSMASSSYGQNRTYNIKVSAPKVLNSNVVDVNSAQISGTTGTDSVSVTIYPVEGASGSDNFPEFTISVNMGDWSFPYKEKMNGATKFQISSEGQFSKSEKSEIENITFVTNPNQPKINSLTPILKSAVLSDSSAEFVIDASSDVGASWKLGTADGDDDLCTAQSLKYNSCVVGDFPLGKTRVYLTLSNSAGATKALLDIEQYQVNWYTNDYVCWNSAGTGDCSKSSHDYQEYPPENLYYLFKDDDNAELPIIANPTRSNRNFMGWCIDGNSCAIDNGEPFYSGDTPKFSDINAEGVISFMDQWVYQIPSISVDFINEALVGFNNTEYAFTSCFETDAIYSVTGGDADLPNNCIPEAGANFGNIGIYRPESGVKVTVSQNSVDYIRQSGIDNVKIPARPSSPKGLVFDYDSESEILGVTTGMEYCQGDTQTCSLTTGNWVKITNSNMSFEKNSIYQVRYFATNSSFKSLGIGVDTSYVPPEPEPEPEPEPNPPINVCPNNATNYPDCDDNNPKPPAPPVLTCLSTQHNLNGKCIDNLPTSILFVDKMKTLTTSPQKRETQFFHINVKSIYGDISLANQKVAWSSSDKSVALVNSSGKVTAKKTGVTTITVKT
ncbi:MAG: Ig-like domain-containing protein, partial [Candidatus Ancillula sp.]|nr:Ig-like domain-containing protein [Candidatus Ancillula sp.]